LANTYGNKRTQFEVELRENILPFWMKYTPDRENGGFYGALTNDKAIRNEVERSAVLCGRILWTFSTAARLYADDSYLKIADWAFDALSSKFWDLQFQGVYWSIDKKGVPVQDRKHTYAQAFSIYGLSAYYQTCGNLKSLALAKQLFELIESHTHDPIHGGNLECRGSDWSALTDMRLSDKDLNSAKSMNTLLHLMEAYAALTTIWPDKSLRNKLEGLLHIFLDHVIDMQTGHQRLFFDGQWHSLLEHVSYGHDIETSWLFLESAEVLGNADLIGRAKEASVKMAQAVYNESLGADGSILYESGPHGYRVLTREWWASAEAVVGFYNAYQVSGQEHFAEASERAWKYIQNHFVDRENGDWFKLLEEDGKPILSQVKVGPWQCPYHHARMCFEMIRRINE
jgi:mannobiose 2-epimerase